VPGTHYLTAVGRHSGLSAQAQFSVSTSWAQYRYSGKHEGFNPYENVLSASNVSGIDIVWIDDNRGAVLSSPVVADGVVYVGSQDHNVYALSAAIAPPERVVWIFGTGGPVFSSPAVADGVVYVGSDDGSVYAVTVATAPPPLGGGPPSRSPAKIWSFPTGGGAGSPAVADGVVYIGSLARVSRLVRS
jgi:eukaryotic-like serine/threonine-protein kinase